MGYNRHHAIIVTGFDAPTVEKAHDRASTLAMSVGPLERAPSNSWWSFCIFTDGSKEGWGESDRGDAQRAEFIAYLDSMRYEDGSSPLSWVEVQYGDDERVTKVTAHSDEPKRTAA